MMHWIFMYRVIWHFVCSKFLNKLPSSEPVSCHGTKVQVAVNLACFLSLPTIIFTLHNLCAILLLLQLLS